MEKHSIRHDPITDRVTRVPDRPTHFANDHIEDHQQQELAWAGLKKIGLTMFSCLFEAIYSKQFTSDAAIPKQVSNSTNIRASELVFGKRCEVLLSLARNARVKKTTPQDGLTEQSSVSF